MNGLEDIVDAGLAAFIRKMPKVELHVHLEGSIRPETLLALAARNRVDLPASSIEELRRWYVFKDFPHFAEVYQAIARCIRTTEDLEALTRDFLTGQASQNIRYSEVTYTALTQFRNTRIPFKDQLEAINRARRWAEKELYVSMGIVIDVPREFCTEEESLTIAEWAISGMGDGVVALGLGGYEVGFPPERFAAAFRRARDAGLPGVPHAGETMGAPSNRGALEALHAVRIGHGVRCLEDAELVAELRSRQVPLEVCPTSNVCLNVASDLASHPLPVLLNEGLYVTINTDDPPLFNTTLTKEFVSVAEAFHLGAEDFERLTLNALRASFLPQEQRQQMEREFVAEFASLRADRSIE